MPLPRIKKLSGPFLHRSWLNVPHVTHNDEADITDLDPYRRELDTAAKAEGYRVTLLAFLMKAAVSALRQFPEVNSSLSPDKDSLILKRYYHIGIAVDTPGGLVVPVIKDVEAKGVTELSKELGDHLQEGPRRQAVARRHVGRHASPSPASAASAAPASPRSSTRPRWRSSASSGPGPRRCGTARQFVPRLMLPVSLSYDHRVIDGALAARFTRQLCHRARGRPPPAAVAPDRPRRSCP